VRGGAKDQFSLSTAKGDPQLKNKVKYAGIVSQTVGFCHSWELGFQNFSGVEYPRLPYSTLVVYNGNHELMIFSSYCSFVLSRN
jgi:hypothetical protein